MIRVEETYQLLSKSTLMIVCPCWEKYENCFKINTAIDWSQSEAINPEPRAHKQASRISQYHSVSSILIMVRERLNKKHLPLREGSRYQIRWIFGKIPNGLWPPPNFWKIILQYFYNGYGRIYARRHRPE